MADPEVDGGLVTYTRVRGGGCFGPTDANRIELGVVGLQDCANKVHLNIKCSAFFEFDTAASGGVAGHGWCGCGAKGGNECAGADVPGSTNAIYHMTFTPGSQWGFFFLLFSAIGAVLYLGGGFALGRRQGRDAQSGAAGQLAVHPHHAQWCAFVGLVQDGAVYSKARLDERIRNSPGQEQGYESLSEPAATNAVAASVASSAAADSDDELVE